MTIDIPCGALRLEAVLQPGRGAGAAVICHPHPQYGGTMHNPAVLAVAEGLQQADYTTLCFNFRGVGRSTGHYGGGLAEQDDARAALAYVLAHTGASHAILAGYSFGAVVALAVGAATAAVDAIIAVAPPLAMSELNGLSACTKSTLFLVGDADQFCPVAALEAALRRVPQPTQTRVLRGADHFLFGYEADIAAAVRDFATRGGAR